METLQAFFKQVPMAALFASLAMGYLIGKVRIGEFQLGGMTGTLLAAVAIGQIGVPVDPVVKQMMFALFIFTTGYVCGPQFFVNLNRKTLNQITLKPFVSDNMSSDRALLILTGVMGSSYMRNPMAS